MNKDVLSLAINAHDGQFRKSSNQLYISHPIEVANLVALHLVKNPYKIQYKGEQDVMVNAAICHDTLEDTDITEQDIIDVAGKRVANLVLELTNPSKGSNLSRSERKAMDREHLAGVSWAAKVIKLIDRTCNLRDMIGFDSKFIKKYAEESQLLLEVLQGTDSTLEAGLQKEINNVLESIKDKV